jgi:hypothetical protein
VGWLWIAYFIGGKTDVAFSDAADDFAKIASVSVFLANRDVGHCPGTYREPPGTEHSPPGVGHGWSGN